MKKIFWWLVLMLLILLMIAYFSLFRLSPEEAKVGVIDDGKKTEIAIDTTETGTEQNETKLEFITQSQSGTFRDLLQREGSWICQVDFLTAGNTDNIESEKFYVDNGKLRGGVKVQAPDLNGKLVRHILVLDNILYNWSEFDGEFYGAKISLETVSGLTANQTGLPFDLNHKINYECTTWNRVDEQQFSLPTKVVFKDLNQISNQALEEGIIYKE